MSAEAMNYSAHLNHPLFKTIGKIADEEGKSAYAIGGFVRDLLLQPAPTWPSNPPHKRLMKLTSESPTPWTSMPTTAERI